MQQFHELDSCTHDRDNAKHADEITVKHITCIRGYSLIDATICCLGLIHISAIY